MSCTNLGLFDWTIVTVNQAGSSGELYRFRLNPTPMGGGRFEGTVTEPPDRNGKIKGVCRPVPGGIILRLVMTFDERDAIHMVGSAREVSGRLLYGGTYTNLHDPGDTGSGGGGQTGL